MAGAGGAGLGGGTRQGRPWRPASAPALVAAAALAAAALLGALVARRPGLFHLHLSADPLLWAAIVGGVALALWLLRRPRAALVVLCAFVYLNLSEVLVREHGLPSLLQLLVAPIAVAALAARPWRETVALATRPLPLLLAAWVLLVAASTLWAWDPALAGGEVVEAAKAFVLFLVAALLMRDEARLRAALWSMVGAGTLLAGFGTYQALSGDFDHRFGGLARIKQAQIYGDVFEPRIAGPLGDPNFFAQILLVLVPLALVLAWRSSGRQRAAAVAAAAVLCAGTVFTYSRGGALALAVVFALGWLARGVRVRELAAGVVLLAAALVLAPPEFTRRLTTLEQFQGGEEAALHPDSSFEKRRLVTAAAWRMFLAHPALGVGAGNFTHRFDPFADAVGSAAREYDEPFGDNYPHNLYLEVAAEEGLAGLALAGLVAAFAFATLLSARRRLAAAGFAFAASAAGATALALAGYLVAALFLHGHFQRYLWLLLALVVALGDLARRAEAGEAAAVGAPPPAAGAAAG